MNNVDRLKCILTVKLKNKTILLLYKYNFI